MTDAQFSVLIAAITAGLGLIAAAIRFSAARVVAAMDANTTAMLANTASNAVLSTKVDEVARYVRESERTPVQGVPITPPLPRPRTSG